MRPGAVSGAAALVDLPPWATVREAASLLSYADAVVVAVSILEDIRTERLAHPYPEAVRQSLRVCAAVFAREATA